jgi:hypothetical protein
MTKNKMRRDEDKDEVTATCMNQEKERKNRKVLPYHDKNTLHFDEVMMMMSTLY